MKTRTIFLMLIAVACTMPSFAQDSGDHRYPDTYKAKSPGLTAALSVGSTLLPTTAGILLASNDHDIAGSILFASGIIIGPATGYLYAGKALESRTGVVLRTAGMTASVAGLAIGLNAAFDDLFSDDNDTASGTEVAGYVLFLTGAGLTLFSMVRDWIHSVRVTKEVNEQHTTVQVFPDIDHHTGRPMLGMNVNF